MDQLFSYTSSYELPDPGTKKNPDPANKYPDQQHWRFAIS
jgi:hypothetical protein